jgi:hypothetical protein
VRDTATPVFVTAITTLVDAGHAAGDALASAFGTVVSTLTPVWDQARAAAEDAGQTLYDTFWGAVQTVRDTLP